MCRTQDYGFLIENLVGAHILNLTYGQTRFELCYWRDGDLEIDFVITENDRPIAAIEVKSSRSKKIPTDAAIVKAGINCPRGYVSQMNLEETLMTSNLKDLLGVILT
jgi:predicted AAA+ superfamily ATPase